MGPTRWTIEVGAVLTLVSGCGSGPFSLDLSGGALDERGAREAVEDHIARAADALPGSPGLEEVGAAVASPCRDGEDVTVSKRYRMEGVDTGEQSGGVDSLLDYWALNGYTVDEDLRPDEFYVAVHSEDDGFRMSVRTGSGSDAGDGDLVLSASSPCLDADGDDS